MTSRTLRSLLLPAALLAAPAAAQIGPHPAFQPARITGREYTFAVAGGDATTLLFQWREGLSARSQLTLDLGVSDFDGPGAGAALVAGAALTAPLVRATRDVPLDVAFSGGAGVLVGDNVSQLRIPIGVVAGLRIPLDGALVLSPFAHPRVAITAGDGSDVGVEFDLGAELQFTPALSTRIAARLGNGDAVGIALSLRSPGLRSR